MSAAVVYVTMGNLEQAKSLAGTIVEERLAACANIVPQINSVYHWEGKVQTDEECLIFFKTQQDRVPELMDRVKQLHEYDVPCITSWPITEILPDYFQWIKDSTSSE